MAKISFPEGSYFNPAAYAGRAEPGKTKQKAVRGTKQPFFSRILEDAEAAEAESAGAPFSEEAIHDLLDEVHSAGDALKQRPFAEEIKRYKQAVRNFMHHVVEKGFGIEEQTSGVHLLKRKRFTLLQVIDVKLEQLAAGIMAGQAAQLELLARVDEITGLLVNLLQG